MCALTLLPHGGVSLSGPGDSPFLGTCGRQHSVRGGPRVDEQQWHRLLAVTAGAICLRK